MRWQAAFIRIAGCIAMLALAWTAGCASSGHGIGPDNTIHLALTGSGVEIDGRLFSLDKLSGQLKRMGANPTTSVVIAVPRSTTQQQLAALDRQVRSAGVIRIIFKKPTHAASTVTP